VRAGRNLAEIGPSEFFSGLLQIDRPRVGEHGPRETLVHRDVRQAVVAAVAVASAVEVFAPPVAA
jgi:hypothetical protein